MAKTDRRYQRTHEHIRRCFDEMFMETEYGEMTVSALCIRANINRKTFYHHFESLDAALSEMLGEIVDEIMEFMDQTAFSADTLQLQGVVPGFFRLLRKKRPLHKRILCSPECYAVFERSADMLVERNLQRLTRYLQPDNFRERVILIYATHSILPIYREWLCSEPKMSEEELATLIELLMLKGIEGVRQISV